MLQCIKNNKKILAIVGAVIIIIGGGLFVMKGIDRNTEKDYLAIGIRQEGGAISLDRQEGNNQKRTEEIRSILDKAIPSELTDETAGDISGREILFDISYGTYMDAVPQIFAEIWVQEDGTSIYREGLTKKYYTLDKESTKKLDDLLK